MEFVNRSLLEVLNERMIRELYLVQPYLEIWLSVPGLVLNTYFAWRFSSIGMYNVNFRMLLITLNIITSAVSIIHPLYQILPDEYYSMQNGYIFSSLVLYILQYIQNVGIFVLDVKFLLLGLERRVAFRLRETYEYDRGNTVKRGLIMLIGVSAVMTAIKSLGFFVTSDEEIDVALRDAIIMESSLVVFGISNSLAGMSWAYGCWETIRLKKSVQRHQYTGQTLSESFEIKQTGEVVQLVEYMLKMYIVCVILCGLCTMIAFFLRFVAGIPTGTYQMNFVTNLEYIVVGFYNLYTSLLMLFYFKRLKMRLIKDLTLVFPFLVLLRRGSPPNSVVPKTGEVEREAYFLMLQKMWNKPPDQVGNDVREVK